MDTAEHTRPSLPPSSTEDPGNDTPPRTGLRFRRRFCPPGVEPWETVTWERRRVRIEGTDGEPVFEQEDVEVPASWSQTATNVVVSKYFRGQLGSEDRETSVRQLIGRVVETIANWGREDGYFTGTDSASAFRDDLVWLCLHQHLSFNSPVWFNVGTRPRPQCSACFINGIRDSMESILDLARTEGMLFKWGSGTGTNLSALRSHHEGLSDGGMASGPVSFMRGFDAFAGVIKSGGSTRRAAKMVILDVDHPEIREFVSCKVEEEKKAWALIEAGWDGGFNVPGGAYDSVAFQNANNSVRVSDAYMRAVMNDDDWTTRTVTTGDPMETFPARELLDEIAEAAWLCGDPGIQFDDTVNAWHTCINTDRIRASNPCSEYMFLDDSACNLASLNLMRFSDEAGAFQVDRFRAAVELTITAQEILVDRAGYPTESIERNSHRFRPLGLGYANLGALLMARGLPYDSDAGRSYAAAITALAQAASYTWSARIAADRGPFEGYARNRRPMLRVVRQHRDHARRLPPEHVPEPLYRAVQDTWEECEVAGREHGFRNAQVTVLAPTGTIGFMMDCDTTGVEPDIALIKYKKLVGGGVMKIVNRTVPLALRRLGYSDAQQARIGAWLEEHETIEGAPGLEAEHLPVFDCAFRPRNGSRSISPMGHLRMMAAVQPFISGAISKTVNVPQSFTAREIADLYVEAWRMGLKAITVYRDGCKRSQPLNTSEDEREAAEEPSTEYRPVRRKLPDERQAITHKFSVAGHEGYVTVGMYDDGAPGEIFIVMAKEGSVVSGLVDGLALSVSLALQYGVPLRVLCDKFAHTRFEPSGFTTNSEIPIAKSILDYIFRWMELRFLSEPGPEAASDSEPGSEPEDEESEPEGPSAATRGSGDRGREARARASGRGRDYIRIDPTAVGLAGVSSGAPGEGTTPQRENRVFVSQADAPPCSTCGSIMVRSGTCYKCLNCGVTSGCS